MDSFYNYANPLAFSPPTVPDFVVVIYKGTQLVVPWTALSGGGSYTGVSTTNIGGITAGQTFTAQTLQQMFDALITPYAAPSFSAFGISGVGSPLEVGTSFGPSVTFTWATANSGNVTPNTIGVTDTTTSTSIFTGHSNSGSNAVVLGAAITSAVAGSHSWGITGTNNHAGAFSGALTITWQWRLYYGVQAGATLTGAQILALASSQLATGYVGTFACGASGYKYVCLADAAGSQLNSVKDQSTGFAVPMVTGTFTDGGGFGYEKVSVTNAQSVVANVRVYRTLNSLGGAVTLVVT